MSRTYDVRVQHRQALKYRMHMEQNAHQMSTDQDYIDVTALNHRHIAPIQNKFAFCFASQYHTVYRNRSSQSKYPRKLRCNKITILLLIQPHHRSINKRTSLTGNADLVQMIGCVGDKTKLNCREDKSNVQCSFIPFY